MSKQQKTKKVVPVTSSGVKEKSKPTELFSKMEGVFTSRPFLLIGLPLVLAAFTYLLLFDAKVSIGGDDSAYFMRAHLFIKKGEFPFFQGPIYPLILGFIMLFTGINLYALKLLSVLFILGTIFFVYKAYKNQLSPLVLFTVSTLIAVNAYVGLYASMTYSEACFMFALSLFLLFFVKTFTEKDDEKVGVKMISQVFLLSFLIFVLSQIRFVGVATLGAALVFFVIYRKYIHAGLSFVFFGVIYFAYTLLKKAMDVPDGMSSQLELLMNVDPYDASKGQETVGGFIGRFFGNSDLYLGKTFLIQAGLRPEMSPTNSLLTLLVYAVILGSLFLFWKNKNKALVFSVLVLGAVMTLTFLVLQTSWDQDRMIIVCYPLLFLVIFSGLYSLLKEKALQNLQILFPVFAGIFIFLSLARTLPKLQANTLVVQKNLSGDKYYGFTDDWANFLRMSEYVGKTLPEGTVVGSRKPGMSYVYSNGIEQFAINKIKTENPDELLNSMMESNVNYIIDASLRANPAFNTGQTISTVQRFMYLIRTKYPNTFELVHTIGNTEPAFLYKVNLPDTNPEGQNQTDESL